MTWIDWLIVAFPWVLILVASFVTRRYIKGVADFLAAGRGAGRYLICVAEGAAGVGLITVIAMFEQYAQAGTAVLWWGNLAIPVGVILTLSGFVIYRFRETRALTLAQFFELRYSRAFRVFAGIMAFVSGVINYGIFPGVSARFFVYFLGLPETLLIGGLAIPTFAILMVAFLGLALCFVLLGGQLQILVTDCLAGAVGGFMMLAVAGTMISLVSFEQMFEAVSAVPDGKSLINPFKTGDVKDFNIWYALIGLVGLVYTQMAWQGNQGFNASAANPHEAKMGRILASWRGYSMGLMLLVVSLGAYTFLHHPDFADRVGFVTAQLSKIGQPQIAGQMQIPLVLSYLLPVGIKGTFVALMLLMMVNVDKSYLHSWGSIFIQDVVMPFRKAPLSPKSHLRLLRWSITGVAVWGFFFSLFFHQTDYILMFFAITGALYLGGAGSVIIGGLYWKRGTTSAAWTSMIVGSTLAVTGLVLQNLIPNFPINGQVTFFIAVISSVSCYVGVSWFTSRAPFDLDRMLHRTTGGPRLKKRKWLTALLGYDAEFSRGDKLASGAVFAWNGILFGAFLVITTLNLIRVWPDRWWWNYNLVNLSITAVISVVTVVWFSFGGLRDLVRLFRRLAQTQNNPMDDGTVIDHQNAGEIKIELKPATIPEEPVPR